MQAKTLLAAPQSGAASVLPAKLVVDASTRNPNGLTQPAGRFRHARWAVAAVASAEGVGLVARRASRRGGRRREWRRRSVVARAGAAALGAPEERLQFWLDLQRHPALTTDAVAVREALERHSDEEVMMDLAHCIAELGLTAKCWEAASAWCEEMGAADMEDLQENFDDLAAELQLDRENEVRLKRAISKVALLGGEVAFEAVRREAREQEPEGVQSILLELFTGVKEQLTELGEALPGGRGVDGVLFSAEVSPSTVRECHDMGMPAFIAERPSGSSQVSGFRRVVCQAAPGGSREPVAALEFLQPKRVTSMTTREKQPSAEVWVPKKDCNVQVEGLTKPIAQRLARVLPAVPKLWVQVLRQRSWAPAAAKLDPTVNLRETKTDEGLTISEGAPAGVVLATGTGVYYPAFCLAKFFAWWATSGGAGSMKEKLVLELGAGTGIVGLTLALSGASVVLTDFDVDALNLMMHNIKSNSLDSRATAQFLDWGDQTTYLKGSPVDIVVAAEVLYDMGGGEGDGALLADALKGHMQSGATEAYLSYVYRGRIGFFDTMLDLGFGIERLEDSAGRAAGSRAGQPPEAFEGSRFVELEPGSCMRVLQTAEFDDNNPEKVQILRMRRAG